MRAYALRLIRVALPQFEIPLQVRQEQLRPMLEHIVKVEEASTAEYAESYRLGAARALWHLKVQSLTEDTERLAFLKENIAFLIQLWIVPIPAEFGGLEVEPLEELPEAVADLGERFVERKMFAEVILPLEPQVFCRVLFRGVGSKQQTRHGPLCLRYPRIFASQKLLHLGPPVIAGSIPQV